jgi:hypothetical protein
MINKRTDGKWDNHLEEGWPPTDGEILAVHAVLLASLGHSGTGNQNKI